MEGKLFLGHYLICVILLLGQLYGCKSCIEKERKALLELKKYVISRSQESYLDYVLPTWTNDTKSDCCRWDGINCNLTSGRVIGLSIGQMYFEESFLLNLSLLHPFEEVRSLNLSSEPRYFQPFNGFFDDVEGFKSLRRLKNLEILDLSSNKFNNNIFSFLNVATSLSTLFLPRNDMNGPFPAKELKDLTNLERLDLSRNRLSGSMSGLTRLKKLKALDLSDNDFSSSLELQELKNLTNLELLNLSGNRFNGSMSELKNMTNLELLNLSGNRVNGSMSDLTHLKKLKTLDLSGNDFSISMELQELKNLTNLERLNLSGNRLNSSMSVVCEMKNLREVDLSGNSFVGQLPLCLGSLKKLRVLDLSSNQLSGNLIPYSFSSLESLEYLSLLDNNFTGLFSLNPLANLTKLKVFKLSSTSDMVQEETESTWQPKFQLSVAVLRFCSLEKIPSFLVYQKTLRLVDLSSNILSGHIPTWLLAKNPELEVLQLQNNSFTIFQMPTIEHNLKVLDFSANHIGGMFPDNIGRALPNLLRMNGSNNGFQGHFPSSMGEMKSISFLDLSYNKFSGKLPQSFLMGCFSLRFLKLSHNKFSGHFFPRGTSLTSLQVLRMDNNLFMGKIGVGLLTSNTTLSFLDMSNNGLTGAIPSWISKLSYLDFLLLSNNFLEGTIPPLVDLQFLSFLDLSGNLLSGALSTQVYSINGVDLFLHDNNLTGTIPDTLLGRVGILDMRNNKLSGSIPHFVDTQDINILLLRGNNLTGSIPRHLCDLSNIRILDLSDNKLNGFIPSCLSNLSFGMGGMDSVEYMGNWFPSYSLQATIQLEFYKSTFVVEQMVEGIIPMISYHEYEIKFAVKQRYDSYRGRSEFSRGILDYMYGMDLSNNELSGVIPAELGDLSKVKVLNLSHNFLSSSIPSSFSNLTDIESLDLSYNMLHGSIPYQFTSLTSLAVFDVSHNNLSGIIPQGRQFNTFNESSYLDNPLLCGPPTNISCDAKKSSEEANNGGGEEENESAIDMVVFYYTAASVYVTALIGIVVLMCFDCLWRRAWLCIVDAFIALARSLLP